MTSSNRLPQLSPSMALLYFLLVSLFLVVMVVTVNYHGTSLSETTPESSKTLMKNLF